MGMAASQARFLGLTARKTNVEYEGQQVNQQRTTLSNQSANYYNQLLGMTVPTPPSVADYTKTVYTFDDGALKNSITSMIAQKDGSYLVSYTSSWTDDFAAVSAGSSIVTRNTNNTPDDKTDDIYSIGSQTLRKLSMTIPDTDYLYDVTVDGDTVKKNVFYGKNDDGDLVYYTLKQDGSKEEVTPKTGTTPTKSSYNGADAYLKTLSVEQIAKVKDEEKEYLDKLNKQYGNANWQVRYVQNTSTGQWSPYFYKREDLDKATYSDTGSSQSYIPAYTVGSAQQTEEIKGVNAKIEQDATGRLIKITLNPGKDDEVTYSLTTNTLTDQAKYDDAMNQYEYDKYQYDQSIQEINAKIEIVQSEDKNLELRLKQLDTEQKAISTEMDAVQKVIEKNTESTFKTFG